MRKNIFEILSEGFDLDREIAVLWGMLHKNIITYEKDNFLKPAEYKSILYIVDLYSFKNWKSRGSCVSTDDMMERLKINNIITNKSYNEPVNLLIFDWLRVKTIPTEFLYIPPVIF